MAQAPRIRDAAAAGAKSSLGETLRASGADARHRELATEHLLFQTLVYIERQFPGLFDHLEESIAHLGDHADDDTKDDEAVRDVARQFVRALRKSHG
ncbi:hypothetical protein Rumeso_01413 [Rubellimicrobium mesophilum DSM 19309]|uniref:Uncharacterized protein n=1 Tax=Rubellimicrobium mesophilum DSM 19309 TaxID=442562 RepID=A0A017HS81_9RHOB|nr:hypothetical protein [Rubellimicrobium mesophilum]EYD77003.1 hypothetical protein Rumeso_01413 [Rubellimicrobium mesophilum DSM 19309]